MLSQYNQARLDTIRREISLSQVYPVKDSGSSNCPVCGARGKFYSKAGWGRCYRSSCDLTIHAAGSSYDVVKLYMYREGLDAGSGFYKALDRMELEFGLDSKATQQYESERSLFLREVVDIYATELMSSTGTKARNYLLSRGISLDMASAIGIGYSPHNSILREYGLSATKLEEYGLFSYQKEVFSNRLIFPIRDMEGSIVHMTGRYIGPISVDASGEPYYSKWKHSLGGNSPIGNYLALEDLLRGWSVSSDYIVLTEGYIDTLSLYQLGVSAIGSMGLQGLVKQLPKLKLAKELVAMYDTDTFDASHSLYPLEYKSWRVVLPQLVDLQLLAPDLRISIVMIPGECRNTTTNALYLAKDVNEWVQGGATQAEVKDYISENKVCLVDYMIDKYGMDMQYHSSLIKLCIATGRGRDKLTACIPSRYDPITYAMAVMSS